MNDTLTLNFNPLPPVSEAAIAQAVRDAWDESYARKPHDAYGFGGWRALVGVSRQACAAEGVECTV